MTTATRSSGTINGDVPMAGILSPGHSPGTLTINGNDAQTGSGTFMAEIGGLLQLAFINQFLPNLGDSFTLLTFTGIRTGTFSSLQWGGLPVGYEVLVNYGQNNIWVALNQVHCSEFPGGGETGGCYPGEGHGGEFVPDPGPSLLLLGTALAGLVAARRRWR